MDSILPQLLLGFADFFESGASGGVYGARRNFGVDTLSRDVSGIENIYANQGTYCEFYV